VRTLFIIILLVLGANLLQAQNEIKISGSIVDDSTRYAVPFVTVSVKQTATLSDINGKFNFTISANNADSIIFSCIGYENKKIPIRSFVSGTEQTIKLLRKVYELPPHTKNGLTSRSIIENAIKKIPEIFVADTFYQEGFYRQYHEENNKYVRLIEAAITIENRAEKNNASLKTNERVLINHIRRSDNNEQNNEEHGDHLIDLLEENPVYHSLGTVLNIKSLDLYRFYFDTTLTYPDSVYHIFYYSHDRTRDRYDRGEIFINAKNFAILKLTIEEFKNDRPIRRENNLSNRYRWDFLSSKLIAEYKMKDEKMYTAALMKMYTHELYDNKVYTKEFTVIENFELTLQKEIKTMPLSMQKYFSDFSNLYHRKYFYDTSFWKSYSVPGFYFQKSEDVKRDLEKNKKLEKQFLENGIEQQNK
jgi:CarboxypepD_reg-like domain